MLASSWKWFEKNSNASIVPERDMPLILRMQKTTIIKISMDRISWKPKNDTYCPIPAAIVAMPKIEDIRYNTTRDDHVFFPNTLENMEQKAPVEGYLEAAHARDNEYA